MLRRANGTWFTLGESRFQDRGPTLPEETAKLFVPVQPEGLDGVILAQVDTGAAWSILEAQVAEELQLFDVDGERMRLSTRLGPFLGRLVRTTIELVAERGDSLRIDATVWVSREWPGTTFLGYGGLLERVRFAVDPGENLFHFGAG